jgi:hypothetical protein
MALMRGGVDAPFSASAFNELALRVFRFQAAANPSYGRYVARRGVDPRSVSDWRDVPFLPTRAFKVMPMVSGNPTRVDAVFRTSGTTRGSGSRGSHHVRDLELYRASLLPNFRAHLMPDGWDHPVLCLIPSPRDAPDSSLSFMMGEVMRAVRGDWEASEMRFFATAAGGVDVLGFGKALRSAEAAQRPVLLAGTAFAFVQWLDAAKAERWTFRLAPGSRIMETGGFKGRVRAVPRSELYLRLERCLGIPWSSIVNEYGMTELLSQFYEPVLVEGRSSFAPRSGSGGNTPARESATPGSWPGSTSDSGGQEVEMDLDVLLRSRFHRGPPWVGTLVLTPLTLAASPGGEAGLLAHFDLANLGSVAAVLTEDLGRHVSGGFQLIGRAPGAEPRGCSLAMEDFLASEEPSR